MSYLEARGENKMRLDSVPARRIAIVSVILCFGILDLPLTVHAQIESAANADELRAYPSYQELLDELSQLEREHADLIDVVTIGMSHGDDGDVLETSDNRQILAVKISDRVGLNDDGGTQSEPDVLFLGGQHAREWISVAVPLNLIRYFISSYHSDRSVKELVDNAEIWIVPLVNPDGYEYSRDYDRLWRKNRRDNGDGSFGVDLNRNFPYPLGLRWDAPLPNGTFTSTDSSFETYRGEGPFSEPESQAIRELVEQNDFQLAISFHNYGQTILFPWGVKASAAKDKDRLASMAERMTQIISSNGGSHYRPTQSYDPLNFAGGAYLKHGEISDWLYDLGVLAFTIELRPDTQQGGGFLLPIGQIPAVIKEMIPVAEFVVDYAIQQNQSEPSLRQNLDNESVDRMLDINGNGYLDDSELFVLVDYWIEGMPISGSNVLVDNEMFFFFLDKWSAGQPLLEFGQSGPSNLAIHRTAVMQQQGHFNLSVEGNGIERIHLRVFNMAGEELMQRDGNGARMEFRLFDEVGHELANGTYLYTVTAYAADRSFETTQVKKFVVLRNGFRSRMNLPSL